jgi:hypothetical protein
MRMKRHGILRRDPGVEYAHVLIFEQNGVVRWRGNDGIERVGPRSS